MPVLQSRRRSQHDDNFFSPKPLILFNSGIVREHFVSQTPWNNRDMATGDSKLDFQSSPVTADVFIIRAILCRYRVRLKNVAQGWENGTLGISSRDNLWYAKNHDISLRIQSYYIFEKITKNGRQPLKPKNHRNEIKFQDQTTELA